MQRLDISYLISLTNLDSSYKYSFFENQDLTLLYSTLGLYNF